MKYNKEMVVEQEEFEEMVRICKAVYSDIKKDGIEFDREVVFENGNRMAIQVCGPGRPDEESCWTQGVLFDHDGNELGCTHCGDSFEGEYWVDYENDQYIVNVKKA